MLNELSKIRYTHFPCLTACPDLQGIETSEFPISFLTPLPSFLCGLTACPDLRRIKTSKAQGPAGWAHAPINRVEDC